MIKNSQVQLNLREVRSMCMCVCVCDRSREVVSPALYTCPRDLPACVCPHPNRPPLADVSAQVPSHPRGEAGGSGGTPASGPRLLPVLEEPPAPSPKGKLMETWLESGS